MNQGPYLGPIVSDFPVNSTVLWRVQLAACEMRTRCFGLKILGATVQNLFVLETKRPGFVHLCILSASHVLRILPIIFP
jgi:hypothetical protein